MSSRSIAGRPGIVRVIVPAVGLPLAAVAVVFDPHAALAATDQNWPPFVLVSGLLLLGLVARADGLFEAGGTAIALLAPGGFSLLAMGAVLIASVTAVLNLDTAVAFITPVLLVAARRRGVDQTPLLYLSVFLANGASLLLPGSNLTNLIVIGQRHESGGAFAGAMLPAWIAAVISIPLVIGLLYARRLAGKRAVPLLAASSTSGAIGIVGVALAVVVMLVAPTVVMALVVAAIAASAFSWRLLRGRLQSGDALGSVNVPVLAGLLGLAIAGGTLGRAWDGPSHLLAHASTWEAAVVGAAAAVVINNLPAASLLAARAPLDPHALLVGLNLGPNLAVTGSLSAVIWLQVGRASGATPSPKLYTKLGLVVVPVSIAAAVFALVVAR